MTEKPLFIPLKAKWFEAFEQCKKTIEYRVYGPRWNEKTCRRGRAVTLSYGYGKARRLYGVITGFKVVGPQANPAIRETFPTGEQFAAIFIHIDMKHLKIDGVATTHAVEQKPKPKTQNQQKALKHGGKLKNRMDR